MTLPSWYLEDGHLTHVYAITGHKAQGLTCDEAFILGSDVMYREWGYTALSRGRASNRLYLVATDPVADEAHTRHRPEPHDPLQRSANNLRRSHAKHLAIDERQAMMPPAPRNRPATAFAAGQPPNLRQQRLRLAKQRSDIQRLVTDEQQRLSSLTSGCTNSAQDCPASPQRATSPGYERNASKSRRRSPGAAMTCTTSTAGYKNSPNARPNPRPGNDWPASAHRRREMAPSVHADPGRVATVAFRGRQSQPRPRNLPPRPRAARIGNRLTVTHGQRLAADWRPRGIDADTAPSCNLTRQPFPPRPPDLVPRQHW